MQVDPRLNEIDDCLYRVAARVLIVQNDKVLLIKEVDDEWWALPGGGVDHGETVRLAMLREMKEELGVAANEVTSDFQMVHYSIGETVNGIPRMNLFFKASVPEESIRPTDDADEVGWFTRDEFMKQEMHSSYNKVELINVIFASLT